MPEMLSAATGVVQADSRVSSRPGWCVESGHEFAVGGACCGEVFVAFGELVLKVEVALFELADALVEGVDVGGGTESGFAPRVFAERFRQPLLQLLDARAQPGGSFVGGEQIRLQRRSCDGGADVVTGYWICLQRMDFLHQVTMPVEEGAVDSGGGSNSGRGDPVACRSGLVECRQHALTPPHRVVTATVEHRSNARDAMGACGFR
jgi:hypothetical protein